MLYMRDTGVLSYGNGQGNMTRGQIMRYYEVAVPGNCLHWEGNRKGKAHNYKLKG